MAEQVKVKGLRELKKALKQLPKEVRVKVLQQSLRPSANLVRNIARSLAPAGISRPGHRGGTLREAIVVRAEKKKLRRNQAQLRIGVMHGKTKTGGIDAWYWRFVEFGTIKQDAQPFLVPAFESTKYTLSDMIKRDLKKGIDRTAKRIGRKR